MEQKPEDYVNVSVRIRPYLCQDSTESSCLQVISNQPPVLLVLDRSQTYHFDNIFAEDIDQETVYNESVKPLIGHVKNGYNCTVFAYGQTGTGKTYTMGTSSKVKDNKDKGIIPRTLMDFFSCENDENTETEIYVSFVEIYNDKVFDLLQNKKVPLAVKGFNIPGLSKERVFSSCDARHFLEMGNTNRHTAETKQNSNSSRSHAVFVIHCNVRHSNQEMVTSAKLNLVDLAGSESIKKTGNQGNTFHEGVNINKGLLYIGQVITALSTNSSFVPYRQSIITTILQDSLNKKNFVSLIACINSNPEDMNETIQTLEFASRVKKMKSKPEVNEIIAQYKKENPTLFTVARTSNTPFKRPSAHPYQTPYIKKLKPAPLEAPSSAVESPKSLSSVNFSSINGDVTHNAFSPVIRKYMTQMESSLMEKLQTVIKNTIQRPTRASLLARDKENNTPSACWNKLQTEVSKLVRTEIAQLTTKATRATSSPIESDAVKRVLQYDTPDGENDKNHSIKDDQRNDSFRDMNFKVPEIPLKVKKLKRQRTPSISPIDGKEEPKTCRRSIRLSRKRSINNNISFEEEPIACSSNGGLANKRRRSNTENYNYASIQQGDLLNYSSNNKSCDYNSPSEQNSENEFEVTQRSVYIEKVKFKPRRSVRLTAKDTPYKNIKKVPKVKKTKESPFTAHKTNVLNILNTGNAKQLEKLHSIGVKTAEQILLFRELKGSLKQISDLSQIPGWGMKKFEKFMSSNFLKTD